ncbi:MAG: glycerophosphodiester phosphodiesterase [Flavobacteriales bacterium]|nr:glycerophosphodiester phosphodiesterase [Flavobacteriales bacterium]
MTKNNFYLLALTLLISSCHNSEPSRSKEEESTPQKPIDYQGHRGCRGLLPENTIPAFKKALDLGVQTLEMDVVITKDKKVLLSHEPWFSHEIALDPEGEPIELKNERSHLIYQMTFEETQNYDVGLRSHSRFPEQEKMKVTKPLLSEVIQMAEKHSGQTSRELPFYNIETKTKQEGDNLLHPEPEEFVDLLAEVIQEEGITQRAIIQSFDVRTLQVAKQKYPHIKLALLIENDDPPEENLESLGFTPDIYSPDYTLVDEELISYAREKSMAIIPWTINETSEMESLIELGVDGIITDYPDRVLNRK